MQSDRSVFIKWCASNNQVDAKDNALRESSTTQGDSMSSFDSQNLFDAGPHSFHADGLVLRHATHENPGARGARVTGQGVRGRTITQTGQLFADDAMQMKQLTEAIEAKIDGQAHVLIDDHDRSWPDSVMLAFKPQSMRRVGTRWAITYRIEYLQVTP